jgi:hypothetical protein
MNYFLIALSSLAVTQTALAKISPQTLASNNSAAVHANEPLFKANIGFIINNETNEVYCKFNRDNSPGSFPPFSGASYENQQGFDSQSSQYSSVSNCTQDQLAFSESIAQQSMNDNLKLAGLPIAAGGCDLYTWYYGWCSLFTYSLQRESNRNEIIREYRL